MHYESCCSRFGFRLRQLPTNCGERRKISAAPSSVWQLVHWGLSTADRRQRKQKKLKFKRVRHWPGGGERWGGGGGGRDRHRETQRALEIQTCAGHYWCPNLCSQNANSNLSIFNQARRRQIKGSCADTTTFNRVMQWANLHTATDIGRHFFLSSRSAFFLGAKW